MGREEKNFAFDGMVGSDAELPFRVRTSPIIIAELVHRKLNLCAGGIAQMKKRMPHIRTQESFASGTASVHATESVIVPVKVISLAAGTTENQISDLYHSGRRAQRRTPHMLHSTNGAVQVSAWIRPPVTSTPAITPSAASSLRPVAAPVCFSLQHRCGKSWWQGQLSGVVSRHLFVSMQEGMQSLVSCSITDSVRCRRPYRCAVSFSPTAEGCFAMQVRERSCGCDAKLVRNPRCMAGRLITNRAIIQTSGGIRPPVTSTPAIPPSAASSLRPTAEGCFSMQVREWSCAAGLLIETRAIVPVSGWIRPPFASARAGLPAASSLPPATAPVLFSLQCSCRGCFRAVLSGHLFVSRPEGKQSLLDLAIADSVSYSCAGRSSQSSPAAIGCDAKLVRDARCMAGRLITNRAIIQASGWIRPPVTSTPAIPPSAASSLRPVAVRMCHASLCASHRPVLKEDFISTPSRLLGLLSQAGAVSQFGCAVLPYCCVVRVGITSAGSAAKHVCDARCMAGRLLTNRAIIQTSGGIRPPVTSTPAIPPSAASSLRPTAEGCFSMQVREWSCAAGLLMKTRAIVSVSGWIRPPLASARACPPAASSLPPATAPVFFSLQCSCRGCFRAVLSAHLFISRPEGKQSLLDLAIADSVSYSCAGRSSQSSPAAIGCDAKLVRDPRCMAGRLITNRAIIQASGLICPPVTSTPAIPPSAASSLRPVAAPVCFSIQHRRGKSWWQGQLSGVVSRHLFVSTQEGKQSLVSCSITDSVRCRSPYRCAVSFSPTAEGCFAMQVRERSCGCDAKLVRNPRCMAGRLITNRAIIQTSGGIRPPVTSTPAIPPSAASSLRPTAEGCFSMQVREWSCAAGLLMKTRAIVSVSGWIRPPLASARACPPAASSLPPATAPVFFSLQCSCRGCFRAVLSAHLFISRPEGKQSLLDLAIADSVSYSCAGRSSQSSPAAIGCDAKLVRDPRCMAGRLITNRAIIQASGLICPRSAHDQRKCRALEGFVGVHSGKRLALVFPRHAHQSSSKQANHSARCVRCQDLVHGARMAVSNTLRPVKAAPKRHAVLRSFTGASRMWAPPGVEEPSPKVGMSRPASWPSATFMLRVRGAARAGSRDFRPDAGLEAAVQANCVEVSPVEETLRSAQVPFVVMIRNLLPLLPSQALQGRQVLLDLVLVGHSHGGVIAHSMAQSLESAGFLVRGIVAADTTGLPRKAEMPIPIDPPAIARHRSPYHWHLSSPNVNMMAPEVPWRIWRMRVGRLIASG